MRSKAVLIQEDGSLLWCDGTEQRWNGPVEMMANIAGRYSELGRPVLHVCYPPSHKHFNFTVDAGRSNPEVSERLVRWGMTIDREMSELDGR